MTADAGVSGKIIPIFSSISALPERLEMERLPCFTMLTPDAAASNPVPVDRFKLPEPSPPVPTVSTVSMSSGIAGFIDNARIPLAKPRISSADSPFALNPVNSAPDNIGEILSSAIANIKS